MAIQAQPESIFTDLVAVVFAALVAGDATEFQIKCWERDAEKLRNASAADSLEVKAHLAALRGNDAESDSFYTTALKMTSDYTGAAVRYLSVLAERMRQEKLLEVFRDLETALEGDPSATRYVEELLAREGFVVSAYRLSAKLETMGSYSAGREQVASEKATQCMDLEGLNDAEFGAPVIFAKRFLAQRKCPVKGTSVMPVSADDSPGAIFFQFRTDLSPEEAVETEASLFEALDEQAFPLETQGRVVLGVVGTRVLLD